jgi:hypothetical protein
VCAREFELDPTDPLFASKLALWRMAAPVGHDTTKRVRVFADSCCHTVVRQSFGLLRILVGSHALKNKNTFKTKL